MIGFCRIRFELGLGKKFGGGFMIAAEIDLTLFAQRMHFGFEFDLQHPARSILSAKDSGMYKYKKGLKQPRTSVMYNAYDPPNPFTDFDLTGSFFRFCYPVLPNIGRTLSPRRFEFLFNSIFSLFLLDLYNCLLSTVFCDRATCQAKNYISKISMFHSSLCLYHHCCKMLNRRCFRNRVNSIW